jgi:hypothetical protein
MVKLETALTRAKEVSDKRMEICRSCEHFRERTTQCKKCGCFMRFKTAMMKASCPIDKWSKEE